MFYNGFIKCYNICIIKCLYWYIGNFDSKWSF